VFLLILITVLAVWLELIFQAIHVYLAVLLASLAQAQLTSAVNVLLVNIFNQINAPFAPTIAIPVQVRIFAINATMDLL
jgi:hypothetical protein